MAEKTTLADFRAGSRVLVDFGTGFDPKTFIVIADPVGHLDSAIGHKGLIPIVESESGCLTMKVRTTPAVYSVAPNMIDKINALEMRVAAMEDGKTLRC